MKQILYCKFCDAYHYMQIFFTFVFYKDNKPVKTCTRVKCLNCNKKFTQEADT